VTRLAWVLGVVAVGAQISYPLTTGHARDGVTQAVVVLIAATCVVHAADTRGWRWAASLLAITVGGGLVVEAVGTATGLPFGHYAYADGRLGPVVAGVPVVVGLAWTAGAYPAWCAAQRVALGHRPVQVLLAAVGLASWDLYLDPQMVADGRWRWVPEFAALPGLPEIPLSNYLGWMVTAVLMMLALHVIPGADRAHADVLPVWLYLWTWLGSALAQAAFLGLPVSASYGLAAMGVLGLPVLWSARRAVSATTAPAGHLLARWARASFGDRTLAGAAFGDAGRAAARRVAAAQRMPPSPDDHGDLRR